MTHMKNLKMLFKEHKKAFFFAFAVGVLFVMPQVCARIDLGDKYQGAPFLYQSDDENYLENIQEIMDGHLSASSPIYYGYKDSTAKVLPIGEYLYAIPAMLLHIPILWVVMASKFLFPALLFLLVYVLIYVLVKEDNDRDAKLAAIAGGLLVVLGYDFVDFGHVASILKGVIDSGYSSIWARLVNPITGALFLFTFLIILWNIIQKNNHFLPYAGGVLAASMVGYFFSFAITISITFVLLLVTFFLKKWGQFRSLFVVIVIGVLPVIPSVFAVFKRSAAMGGEYAFTKVGLLYTHAPLFNKFLILVLSAFFLVSLFAALKKPKLLKGDSLWWWYCAALLVGTFLVFVQQSITGLAIWPQHFVQYSIPLSYVVGVVSWYKFVHPWSRKIWVVGMYLIIAITGFYGVWMVSLYTSNMKHYLSDQRYVPVYQWLNKSPTKDDCVVLMSEDENYLSGKIPAYTHCDVYYSVQNYYGVPQDRVEHGYFSWLRIRGVTMANIDSYLNNHRMEVRSTTFTNWLELWHASEDPWLVSVRNEKELNLWEDDSVAYIKSSYKTFLASDFELELKRYRLDYIIWDREKYPTWDSKNFPFLKKTYEANGLVVFTFKP